MKRYHIDVHDGTSYIDDEGQELPDDQAAKRMGMTVVAEAVISQADDIWAGHEWSVVVRREERLVGTLVVRALIGRADDP